MAYEKEMPKEFFQFNGRTVYGYKPVYWDSNKQAADGTLGDWVVVGNDAPMPIHDKELVNVKAELQAIKTRLNETLDTQLTGSLTGYADEPFPQGQEGFSLSVVDRNTNEVTFYKYVMGDWRLLG